MKWGINSFINICSDYHAWKCNCLFTLNSFPSLGYLSDFHVKLIADSEIQRAVEGSQKSCYFENIQGNFISGAVCVALAHIWLWGPEPDLYPTMSPSPWADQPQLHALPLQLQGSAWLSHAPQLAQLGRPSRSSSVTPLTLVWAGSHCSSLPGSGSHEVPLHPSTTVDQALQLLGVSCSPILLGHHIVHALTLSGFRSIPSLCLSCLTPLGFCWFELHPEKDIEISGAALWLWGYWNIFLQEVLDQASELRLDA